MKFNQIDKIEKIRARNNKLWMNILRIAMEANPEKTKKILAQISDNDVDITILTKEIAHERMV